MNADLSPMQRRLVDVLLARLGQPVPVYKIMWDLYGWDWRPDDAIIKVMVYYIRKKGCAIKTVRGRGYMMGLMDE